MRLTMVALFVTSIGLVTPAVARAADDHVKLALLPVGQAGSFFDLTMEPGATRTLEVSIGNAGDTAVDARTFAADVYTIINGGFGGRLRDQPRSGMTRWIDYKTDVVRLLPGDETRRSFTVAVPPDAGPGEYITSLILENDRPMLDGGTVGLNQVLRQAVAVVVTVPGLRSPGLAIGEATHEVVAGRSIVKIAVNNTGNIRLKPLVGFVLVDATGTEISQTSMQMDTFYAWTSTFVEIPLATLLRPGTYAVRLTLDDPAHRVGTARANIPLIIPAAPAESAGDNGVVPDLVAVRQSAAATTLAPFAIGLGAGGLLAMGIAWLMLRRRRIHRDDDDAR